MPWFTDPGFFGDERDIYNAAIIAIGGITIDESSDGSDKSHLLCVQRYPKVRDAVLRSHPWNCAKARAAVSLNVVPAPVFGFDHQYDLPADCLRFWKIFDQPDAEVRIEGRLILTDAMSDQANSKLYIEYITRPVYTIFDTLLSEAIAAALASAIAYSISGSQSVAGEMFKLFTEKVKLARRVDGQETGYEVPAAVDYWLELMQ